MESSASDILRVAKEVITWMDGATIIFAFGAMFFTLINFLNAKKELNKIAIYFNTQKVNLDITRKDVTRAELQGILGVFRKDMKVPYQIEYLSTINYLDAIYKVQTGDCDILQIEITAQELEQFRDDIY